MTASTTSGQIVHRTCFGVSIALDASAPNAAELADAYDLLNDKFQIAIDGARDRVRSDRRRQLGYKAPVSPLQCSIRAAAPAANVSLLGDCGLPMVDQFGPFLDNLHSEVSAATLPFVGFGKASGYGKNTIDPLWSPPLLLNVIPIDFGFLSSYHQHVNYLTRLNPNDDIWQDSGPQQWFTLFGDVLKRYMTDLFSGQFIDRNGTALSFDVKSVITAVTSLNPQQISPQLAGEIVSALVEFLGDQLFQVPLYSSDILSTYRNYRKNLTTASDTLADEATLSKAVELGSIAEADSKRLLGLSTLDAKNLLIAGYNNTGVVPVPPSITKLHAGDDIPVACDALLFNANATPLVRSGVARLVLSKLPQLDGTYPTQLATASGLADTVKAIQAGQSKLQAKFTCFKAGVVTENIECIFVTDPTAGNQGVCGPGQDSGRAIADGNKADYADLVGTLVAFGAATAEKSVRSIVGGLIRGVAIASLQNEVIAEVVASLAGGLAKKFVESAAYNGIQSYIVDDTTVTPQVKRASLKVLASVLAFQQ